MRYAETGYNLEIDLTRGNIERVSTNPEDSQLYLGGLGTNAKIMWDRVAPEVEAFSPENLLIFSAGLLCGTPAIGCNRTIVTTISPVNQLLAFSMMGGFWAPELKHAGYDKVILRGKSPNLVYIWINNDKVEIRDASHLKGKGSVETAKLICDELKEPKAQVAAIGMAGENRVFFASIEQGRSSASRGGLGAVMGDKGVKAIVVRGTRDIHMARPAEFMQLCNEVLEYIQFREKNPIPGVMPILAGLGSPQEMKIHDEKWHTENFMWGNSRERRKDFWTDNVAEEWTATMKGMQTRLISCYNCPMKCGATISPPDKPTYMMKCFSKLTYTMAAFSDLQFGLGIAQSATEYGVDGFSAPQVMAFALELLEDGILSRDDFPGMPEERESEGRFYWLLDHIVRREGIGDVLANGTYWAAKQIGRGAEKYAHNNIKKTEQLPLKLSMLNPIYFLMYATGEKLNITQIEGQFPQAPFPMREHREAFVKDWFQVPHEKFKQYFLDWELRGDNSIPFYPTPAMCCDIVDWQERMHYIDDALGMCAGAGFDMDEESLTRAAKRYRTLVRAINTARGVRRKDDRPPANHWKKRFPELEAELLDTYYEFKGWNRQGIPTEESLRDLGLDYVYQEFVARGIYAENEDGSSEPTVAQDI